MNEGRSAAGDIDVKEKDRHVDAPPEVSYICISNSFLSIMEYILGLVMCC